MRERARQIIADLAAKRRVETLVQHTAHTGEELSADLRDLCQETYCILLDYPPERIVALHEGGDMDFFIARLILNQLRSKTSRFYYKYFKTREKTTALEGLDFIDGEG